MRAMLGFTALRAGITGSFHQKAAVTEKVPPRSFIAIGILYWQNERLDRRCPDELIAPPFLSSSAKHDEISANERFKESTVTWSRQLAASKFSRSPARPH
jgi:hypothetical protein